MGRSASQVEIRSRRFFQRMRSFAHPASPVPLKKGSQSRKRAGAGEDPGLMGMGGFLQAFAAPPSKERDGESLLELVGVENLWEHVDLIEQQHLRHRLRYSVTCDSRTAPDQIGTSISAMRNIAPLRALPQPPANGCLQTGHVPSSSFSATFGRLRSVSCVIS